MTLAALDQMLRDGYCEYPDLLSGGDAAELFRAAVATRSFDHSLFLSEDEWEQGPKTHRNTNPGPGYNVLEKLQDKLRFVEHSDVLKPVLTALLGKDYRFLGNKLVCRLPWSIVPDWLQRRVKGKPCNTFGAYIKPQYRDILYFLDNDLHQDIQDWNRMPQPQREHRYITLYVYLGTVTSHDAPVHLIPGSHRLGATPFQHDVTYDEKSALWTYRDGRGHTMSGPMPVITGKAGHAGLWHSCLLHGAPPVKEGHFRISLRYLIGCGPGDSAKGSLIEAMNAQIKGPLFLEEDQTPGARADANGAWNLHMNDFIRIGYQREGFSL